MFMYLNCIDWIYFSKDNGGVMAIPFTKARVIVVAVGYPLCSSDSEGM